MDNIIRTPNGRQCHQCGRPLVGRQQKWCDQSCQSVNWNASHPAEVKANYKRWKREGPKDHRKMRPIEARVIELERERLAQEARTFRPNVVIRDTFARSK